MVLLFDPLLRHGASNSHFRCLVANIQGAWGLIFWTHGDCFGGIITPLAQMTPTTRHYCQNKRFELTKFCRYSGSLWPKSRLKVVVGRNIFKAESQSINLDAIDEWNQLFLMETYSIQTIMSSSLIFRPEIMKQSFQWEDTTYFRGFYNPHLTVGSKSICKCMYTEKFMWVTSQHTDEAYSEKKFELLKPYFLDLP